MNRGGMVICGVGGALSFSAKLFEMTLSFSAPVRTAAIENHVFTQVGLTLFQQLGLIRSHSLKIKLSCEQTISTSYE
eukprot:3528012-Amphidinium_carterae.1